MLCLQNKASYVYRLSEFVHLDSNEDPVDRFRFRFDKLTTSRLRIVPHLAGSASGG
jgi:hypothetical protein